MTRIESIKNFIDKNDKVVDVGCDMAFVGRMLAKRGQKSIASDVSENVIENLKKLVNDLNLNDYITVKLSDGLDNINEELDTVVLAGMGTYTILDIMKRSKKIYKKIITISNNNHDYLRKEMNNLGYKVYKEQIIKEKNKYYNLIVFIPGKYNYSEKEIMLGLNHIDKQLYNDYLEFLLKKYKKIKQESFEKNVIIDKYINYIMNK